MRYVEVSEGQHNRRLRHITERTAAFWNVNSAPFGAYGNTQNPSSAYFTVRIIIASHFLFLLLLLLFFILFFIEYSSRRYPPMQ